METMNDCDHSQRIHQRPLVLFIEREGLRHFVTLRCFACGKKWIEDDVVRSTPSVVVQPPVTP